MLLALGFGAILALALTPTALAPTAGASLFGAADLGRIAYSLKSAAIQAALSAFFSIVVAIPAALAVARMRLSPRRFLGAIQVAATHGFILLISLAMVLPTTVAAMGLLAVWGRNGLGTAMLESLCGGLCGFHIYGMHGVIIAHMMLNVPLVMRVLIPLLRSVHPSKWKLSALLNLTPWHRFVYIEFPAIRGVLPGLASLIFLLCFTSFALVLMLGGGPAVTTLEVEIYSAVRFDFNLRTAASLSLIQCTLTALAVVMIARMGTPALVTSKDMHVTLALPRPDLSRPDLSRFDLSSFDRWLDRLSLIVVLLLVAMPVMMVAIKGLNSGLVALLARPQFLTALKTSTAIALTSTALVTTVAFMMAAAKAALVLPSRNANMKAARSLRFLIDQSVLLYLVIPSVVMGSAAFIILRGRGDAFVYAFGVVVLANTLLALPFAYRLLEGRCLNVLALHERLATQLGIVGWHRLRLLTLPALRHDLSLVAGLSAALSVGDLGVIALFASADFRTLPWLLYQLSGRYAVDEANALALVLMVVTVGFFILSRFITRTAIRGRDA